MARGKKQWGVTPAKKKKKKKKKKQRKKVRLYLCHTCTVNFRRPQMYYKNVVLQLKGAISRQDRRGILVEWAL